MTRKFTYYALVLFAIFFVTGCEDDDVSSPQTSSFTVDKTAGLSEDTEFTFVVDQVNAHAVALLPYGADRPGVLVTSFTDGKAIVKFKYTEVGTFDAVVATTNLSENGGNVSKKYSSTVTITIGSDKKQISEFAFEKSTKTVITEAAKTIVVTVPFGTNVTALKAKFKSSPFTTVKVGGTAQTSETTANNFTSPVVYSVVANDGSSVDYTVTVNVTAVETDNTIKSFGAKSISKATKDKSYGAYVGGGNIVVLLPWDVEGGVSAKDSLRITYVMNGTFAKMKIAGVTLKKDSLLNFIDHPTYSVVSIGQDSVAASHTLRATIAPKLELSFLGLIPNVSGKTTGLDVALKVLNGTTITAIATTTTITSAAGVTVTSMKADGDPFVSGGVVDYTNPVKITLTVNDSNLGITYDVVYTATVTVL
jgi:trimeric autotransporter adhesin